MHDVNHPQESAAFSNGVNQDPFVEAGLITLETAELHAAVAVK